MAKISDHCHTGVVGSDSGLGCQVNCLTVPACSSTIFKSRSRSWRRSSRSFSMSSIRCFKKSIFCNNKAVSWWFSKWSVAVLSTGSEPVLGNTLNNSAGSISYCPFSPFGADNLPDFIASRMVDLAFPASLAAWFRVKIGMFSRCSVPVLSIVRRCSICVNAS